jgi:hypothetical protein
MSTSPDGAELRGDLTSNAITRLVVVAAALASGTAMVLAPGARGLAAQATVEGIDTTSTILTFFSLSLLLTIAFRAMPALFRARDARATGAIIGVSVLLATFLLIPAMAGPLRPWLAAMLMMVALTSAGLGALAALWFAPTRAGGLALLLVSIAAAARALSVLCAEVAAEQARMSWFLLGRGLSTLQVGATFVLLGLIAVWMGTRSKVGVAAVIAAAVIAGIAMWGASRGASAEASRWQAWLNGALTTPRLPESYFGGTLPALLDLLALGFAFGCALLPHSRETMPMALCALCQGTLDVPWRAMAACVAAAWLVAHLDVTPHPLAAPQPDPPGG